MKTIINAFIKIDKMQEKCKHIHTKTIINSGSYKMRKSCLDCGKLLDWEFKSNKSGNKQSGEYTKITKKNWCESIWPRVYDLITKNLKS